VGFIAPSVGVVGYVSRDRQLHQSESLGGHWPSPMLWNGRLIPSLCVVFCRSGVQEGEGVLISTAWQSCSIPGATPCHSIVMEVCSPYCDNVAPRPFEDGQVE
jgi:hypothetical protein